MGGDIARTGYGRMQIGLDWATAALIVGNHFINEGMGDLHMLVVNAMTVLILGHAGIAIFHHYVLRDGLLRRMTPLR